MNKLSLEIDDYELQLICEALYFRSLERGSGSGDCDGPISKDMLELYVRCDELKETQGDNQA